MYTGTKTLSSKEGLMNLKYSKLNCSLESLLRPNSEHSNAIFFLCQKIPTPVTCPLPKFGYFRLMMKSNISHINLFKLNFKNFFYYIGGQACGQDSRNAHNEFYHLSIVLSVCRTVCRTVCILLSFTSL